MDPIALLRESLRSEKALVLDASGENFVLGSFSIPRKQEVVLKTKTYEFEIVWFFVQRKDLSFADYLREAQKAGIPFVSLKDTKYLCWGIS
jgi:hypothetical protein